MKADKSQTENVAEVARSGHGGQSHRLPRNLAVLLIDHTLGIRKLCKQISAHQYKINI